MRVAGDRPLLLRRSRGYVPASLRLPLRLRPAPARVRRRAQEHVRAGQGRGTRGSATTSATSRTTRRCARSRRASSTSSGCSRSSPRWWRTTCIPSTCRPSTRSSSTAWSRSACSTTTPTWRRASPSTARPARRVGAIFDGTGYGGDGTVWGGELLFGDLRGFERAGLPVPGADAGRRGGDPPAVADGVRVAARRRGRADAAPCAAGRPDRLGAGRRARAQRGRVAAHDERGPAVRRRRRALRRPRRGHLRGPGRGRARGRWPTRPSAARYPLPLRDDGGAPLVLDARADRARLSSPTCATASAVATVAARFHNALAAATAEACARAAARRGTETVVLSGGVFQNRRLLAEHRARSLRGRGAAGADARAAAAQRRRHRLRAARGGGGAAGGGRCSGLTTDRRSWRTARRSLVVLAVALLLGLRHASDPDHLAAVSTLIASDPRDGARRAGRLGLAWGSGTRSRSALFGLPVVLFGAYLPETVQRARRGGRRADDHVPGGAAARALARGQFHAHAHRHGALEHRHLHPHDRAPTSTTTSTRRRRAWGGRPGRRSGSAWCTGWAGRPASACCCWRRSRTRPRRVAALVRASRSAPRCRWPCCPRLSATRSPAARALAGCWRSRPPWAC